MTNTNTPHKTCCSQGLRPCLTKLFMRGGQKQNFLVILLLGFVLLNPIFIAKAHAAGISGKEIIKITVNDRVGNGLNSLSESAILDKAALAKAQDMITNDYFEHTSPQGVDPWHWFKLAGYDYQYAGENLAINYFDSGEVNQAWMASSSHRANILNPNYKEIGVAVLKGEYKGGEAVVVVQLFGAPKQSVAGQTKNLVSNENTGVVISDSPAVPETVLVKNNQFPEQQGEGESFFHKFLRFVVGIFPTAALFSR